MKAIFVSILLLGLAFSGNSQDDKKVPEKKLTSGTSTRPQGENKPEKKMVDNSTVKTDKVIKPMGKPERKLIEKK